MDLGLFGWIFVGLIAGSISGWFVGSRSVQGCLPTMIVGVVGGVIGGWLAGAMGLGRIEVIDGARHAAHHSHPEAFLAAVERFLGS